MKKDFKKMKKTKNCRYYKQYSVCIREDTYKKSVFLVVGPLSKKPLLFYKSDFFSPKIGEEKKLSKSVSGYYKTKKKLK